MKKRCIWFAVICNYVTMHGHMNIKYFRNIFYSRRIQQDSIIHVRMFHITLIKYSLILSYFNDTSIFSTDFSTHTQISNFMKIRPVGAELFHVDGQTDT